jgi:hypothetical protein
LWSSSVPVLDSSVVFALHLLVPVLDGCVILSLSLLISVFDSSVIFTPDLLVLIFDGSAIIALRLHHVRQDTQVPRVDCVLTRSSYGAIGVGAAITITDDTAHCSRVYFRMRPIALRFMFRKDTVGFADEVFVLR